MTIQFKYCLKVTKTKEGFLSKLQTCSEQLTVLLGTDDRATHVLGFLDRALDRKKSSAEILEGRVPTLLNGCSCLHEYFLLACACTLGRVSNLHGCAGIEAATGRIQCTEILFTNDANKNSVLLGASSQWHRLAHCTPLAAKPATKSSKRVVREDVCTAGIVKILPDITLRDQ